MNEFGKITHLQGRSRALGHFSSSSEGDEKDWCSSLCSNLRTGDPFQGTGHTAVRRRPSCIRMKQFVLYIDDGAGNLGVDVLPSVRGPPSPGLRARTMDVAQDLMALRGSSHAYNFDCRLCFGRLIGDHDDRFEGFCWSKTLWRHRKG